MYTVYVYIYIYTYMYICLLCIYIYIYTCICIYNYICMYIILIYYIHLLITIYFCIFIHLCFRNFILQNDIFNDLLWSHFRRLAPCAWRASTVLLVGLHIIHRQVGHRVQVLCQDVHRTISNYFINICISKTLMYSYSMLY